MFRDRFVNEGALRSGASAAASRRPPLATSHPPEQLLQIKEHRAPGMYLRSLLRVFALAVLPFSAVAQSSPPPAPPAAFSGAVRPALSQVAQTLNGIDVHRWKAPNSVRDAVDEDVASIQRDLSGTLAGLLQQSDAAPGSVPAAFAVYRNVDALYDTLLRVVETAELAAPDPDATSLQTALKSLEDARANLGDAILSGSETQQAELNRLRAAIQAAAAAQRAAPVRVRTTVIDDGPAPARTTHHRHTTSSKKPQTQPAHPSDANQNQAPHR